MSVPQVSVLLWHQCENNLPYFKLAVEALSNQKNQEHSNLNNVTDRFFNPLLLCYISAQKKR